MILSLFLRGRTHVRFKGQNLNFFLETHATPHNIHVTPHNIYFIRLRFLPRILGTLYWRVDDPLARIVFHHQGSRAAHNYFLLVPAPMSLAQTVCRQQKLA